MADVTALVSISEYHVEQGETYDSGSDVVRKHPDWFTKYEVETQDTPGGEWRDETAAETEAADAAGTPVEPEAVPEPLGEEAPTE